MDETTATVTLERRSNVAVLTLVNPSARNAITPGMGDILCELCDQLDADPTIGAVVVRGADGQFCAGADRRTWDPTADQSDEEQYGAFTSIYSAFTRVGTLKAPTIAAVRGSAVGAGLNLAMSTDLRIVADSARLMAGFMRIGLHPGGGFFTLLNRLTQREATAALGIFSEEVNGTRAMNLGLAWDSVADDAVEDRAFELAERAAQDPELARQFVRSFRTETDGPGLTWEAAVHFERATQMWSQRRRGKAGARG
ncbi:enoyl-CoA hydratase/isomerase family protein [Microbacterium esteraromaticum]|uniref:enoyl-CoA hydratase/isomerase family protein n=1 Tax=Microbacterium esteraromaticum TaxID=57043 RepID=UPI001C94E6AE|nr:enoyl-CoA hydratase/isomerase family protein [Microbacterium esteraromaticum]MBY6062393.1 enoyl-CoA hydratase/isomerase family protein [Microbacterium esteraromaticum]